MSEHTPEIQEMVDRLNDREAAEAAIKTFAWCMEQKFMQSYDKGRRGWDNPEWAPEIRQQLLEHVDKGDPVDVGLFAAFAWFHKQSLAPVNEWISWNGGNALGPKFEYQQNVMLRFRDGTACTINRQSSWRWTHTDSSDLDHDCDIMAYKVIA